ncbi:rhomboid family protein [Stylonychia lemnae]|uniref:Rhomboid-like protease n=1 Tax=Stylonychia lemnae TaxID=5949 RepID=A0A077ZZI8_STYLE|nr:rhomboid family protein [Stylonychia lemnae]|eukprot:CDW75017.1 rhomboid family protein [Stylonychia lemnae]
MEARPLIRGSLSQPAANFMTKPAREERFVETIHYAMCPFLSIKQFVFLISLIQCGLYTASVAYKGVSNNGLLAPQSDALFDFGEKYPYYMKYQYQIWRFVMPVFLHGDFIHLSSNLLSQLIIGSYLESTIGFINFGILYICSGIGGILFSSLATDSTSVGASTAIFGLIGSFASYLMVNWKTLDRAPDQKYQIFIFLFLSLLLNLSMTSSNTKVDSLGHLGGFLTGIIMALFLGHVLPNSDASSQKYQKMLRILGIVLTIVYFVGGFVLFYTLRQPNM